MTRLPKTDPTYEPGLKDRDGALSPKSLADEQVASTVAWTEGYNSLDVTHDTI
jgi:hypothetical protein